MKTSLSLLASILLGLLLSAACSPQDLIERLAPKKESKMAKDFLAKLRERDFEYVKSNGGDVLRSEITDSKLNELAGLFRQGTLLSTELVGANVQYHDHVWHANFTYEYQFSDGWNIANIVYRKTNDKYEVVSIHVTPTEQSLTEISAFSVSDKTIFHYATLLFAVMIPVFILTSAYFCLVTPGFDRKWLWLPFIVVGISAISLDWTSGDIGIQPIGLYLFGASITKSSPLSPWIVSISLPLGAILFWIRRKRVLERHEQSRQFHGPDNEETPEID